VLHSLPVDVIPDPSVQRCFNGAIASAEATSGYETEGTRWL
jgi:hypothetical protein